MEENDVPVFIKLDEYKDILDIVSVIKKKIAESNNTLLRIKQLKTEEDSEIETWQRNLADVYRQNDFLGELLTEPKF